MLTLVTRNEKKRTIQENIDTVTSLLSLNLRQQSAFMNHATELPSTNSLLRHFDVSVFTTKSTLLRSQETKGVTISEPLETVQNSWRSSRMLQNDLQTRF